MGPPIRKRELRDYGEVIAELTPPVRERRANDVCET